MKKTVRIKRIYSYLTPSEMTFINARAKEKELSLSNLLRELVKRYQKTFKLKSKKEK